MVLFQRQLASFTNTILCMGTRWIRATDHSPGDELTKTYHSQNQQAYNKIIVNDFFKFEFEIIDQSERYSNLDSQSKR